MARISVNEQLLRDLVQQELIDKNNAKDARMGRLVERLQWLGIKIDDLVELIELHQSHSS